MLLCYIFVVVPLVNLLHDVHVSGCDRNCTDKPVFTPSRLVVKVGDPTSASCAVCRACNTTLFGVERSMGHTGANGTMILWMVDRMTEWTASPMCYYTDDVTDAQCCSRLLITVYQPPENVSISVVNHTGPMFEGHQYTLQCTVWDVAPVGNLLVTFHRGQTALGQPQSINSTEEKPVTEIFTLNITSSKEDDGAQYWCEAKLELGPEGPQRPPVVMSQIITATVYYKPQLTGSSHPHLNNDITEGSPLQLDCSAVGNPSPSYTWTHPSAVISPSNGSILTINSVSVEQKGQYTCSASNIVGHVTVEFNVDVQVNHSTAIILGTIIAAVLIVAVAAIIYSHYYKHNRMGRYNLKDVFRLHTNHTTVPIAE